MGTLIGIVIGVVVTIIVSRHYYYRSQCKSLTVFNRYNVSFLADIDTLIRDSLKIEYQGRQIEHLQKVEFVVANDGELPIKDPVEPLKFKLPKGSKILESTISIKSSPSIQVELATVDEDTFEVLEVSFPLLNAGEYFTINLLVEGEISRNNSEFEFASEGLPRRLAVQQMGFCANSGMGPLRRVKFLLLSLSVALIPLSWIWWNMMISWEAKPQLFPYPWSSFELSWQSIAYILFGILTLGIVLVLSLFVLFCGVVEHVPSICQYFVSPRLHIRENICREIAQIELNKS